MMKEPLGMDAGTQQLTTAAPRANGNNEQQPAGGREQPPPPASVAGPYSHGAERRVRLEGLMRRQKEERSCVRAGRAPRQQAAGAAAARRRW